MRPRAPADLHDEMVSARCDHGCGDDPPILVVDDDPYTRELVNVLLDSHGYRVHAAEGTAAAVEYLRHRTVRLVILDGDARGMNTASVIAELQQHAVAVNEPPPVVVMTAAGPESDGRRSALEAGAAACCHKPLSRTDLAGLVALLDRGAAA
jgi:two-component system, OmpR family, response regulator